MRGDVSMKKKVILILFIILICGTLSLTIFSCTPNVGEDESNGVTDDHKNDEANPPLIEDIPQDNPQETPREEENKESFQFTVVNEDDTKGEIVDSSGVYEEGSLVLLSATIQSVYGFEGWYDEDGVLLSDDMLYTFSMPRESKQITARWTVNPSLNAFEYEIDGEKVTILGALYDGIENLVLPEEATDLGDFAFSENVNLTSVVLHSGVVNVGAGTFKSCTNLATVTLGCGVKTLGRECFYGCENLENIILTEGLLSIGPRSFYNCKKLAEIDIPTTVGAIEDYAFRNCVSLKEAVIPQGVNVINAYLFDGCTSLERVTLPESITFIDNNAFNGCNRLVFINIPSRVTYIASKAFASSGITTITIPASVTKIGKQAFENCYALDEIIFEKTSYWFYTENIAIWNAMEGGIFVNVSTPSDNPNKFNQLYADKYLYYSDTI